MTGVNLRLSEEDRETITERLRELASFEKGDRVTVEPTEHGVPYVGDDLEGVLLTVEGVVWRDLYWVQQDDHPGPNREQQRREDYGDEEYELRTVEVSGDYGEHRLEVFIGGVSYTFSENVQPHRMPESALISWEQFREEHDFTKLPHEGAEHTTVWIEPAEDPCEICGCNVRRHSRYDNGVVTGGMVTCPACDDTKEEHAP